MINPNKIDRISFSYLQSYNSCPFLFKKHYIDNEPRTSNIWTKTGHAVHYVLEQLSKLPSFDREIIKIVYDKYKEEHNITENYIDSSIRSLMFCINGDFFKNQVSAEERFEFKHNGIDVRGIVDRIDCVNGLYRIIDYKTGKTNGLKDEYYKQLCFYSWAMKKSKNIEALTASIIYPLSKSKEFSTTVDHQFIENWIDSTVEAIKNDNLFMPKACEACPFCKYSTICGINNGQ